MSVDKAAIELSDMTLGHSLGAVSAGSARAPAITPAAPRSYHNPRKLSVLSNMVPPCLKGICYTMKLANGNASVGRLSNVKVDVFAAMREIGAEARARGRGDEDYDLDTCLTGWRTYVWNRFAQLIPLEVDEEAYRLLYHDSKICAVTHRCYRADCVEVL